MENFQYINSKLRESEEWPEEVGQEVIEKLMKLALDDHQLKKKGFIVVNGVSALVINSESGFSWIKIKKVNDEKAWRIDVLFPVKASIVKLDNARVSPAGKVPVYGLPVKLTPDHPFSNWFNLKSDNHKVVVAAPVLEQIFESNNITDEEMNNCSLETTYKTHKGLIPRTVFVEVIHEDDSLAYMKKVSDDQWEITCYDFLIAPRRSRCKRAIYHVVIFCSALTVLLMFILVYIMMAY